MYDIINRETGGQCVALIEFQRDNDKSIALVVFRNEETKCIDSLKIFAVNNSDSTKKVRRLSQDLIEKWMKPRMELTSVKKLKSRKTKYIYAFHFEPLDREMVLTDLDGVTKLYYDFPINGGKLARGVVTKLRVEYDVTISMGCEMSCLMEGNYRVEKNKTISLSYTLKPNRQFIDILVSEYQKAVKHSII
jgi:hypothetical protein